jgi:hypothetical protein
MNYPEGVYLVLEGGLGNQLFMYAAARSICLDFNLPLFIDIQTGFLKDHRYQRTLKLDLFKVSYTHTIIEEMDFISFNILNRIKIIFRRLPSQQRFYISDHYPQNFRNLRLRTFLLKGYWQSERWFIKYQSILRKEFEFKNQPSEEILLMKSDIDKKECSVALHLRTKDYQNKLDHKYYDQAINMFTTTFNNPFFYIFSDDLTSAIPYENLGENFKVISTHNDHEDFYLISQCKHQIIANSTFSWWAAWLNSFPEKLVFVPQNWGFNIEIPSGWTIINN